MPAPKLSIQCWKDPRDSKRPWVITYMQTPSVALTARYETRKQRDEHARLLRKAARSI